MPQWYKHRMGVELPSPPTHAVPKRQGLTLGLLAAVMMPVSSTSLDTREDSRSRMDMVRDCASGMELYSCTCTTEHTPAGRPHREESTKPQETCVFGGTLGNMCVLKCDHCTATSEGPYPDGPHSMHNSP